MVLLYHGFAEAVRDDDPENLFVALPELDAQLRWLRAEGWATLSWAEYAAIHRGERRPPRRSVLITIDDAYVSTREGLEVLARHEAPCIVYAPGGILGETAHWLPEPPDEPLLSGAELRTLQDRHGGLVDFGVHGWDHTSMAERSTVDLHEQTVAARAALERALGNVTPSFAYPFGDHDVTARRAVEEAGFELAFSVFDDVGRFAISRVDVNATDSLPSFRLKLMPGYRRAWRALERLSIVRKAVRVALTRSGRDG